MRRGAGQERKMISDNPDYPLASDEPSGDFIRCCCFLSGQIFPVGFFPPWECVVRICWGFCCFFGREKFGKTAGSCGGCPFPSQICRSGLKRLDSMSPILGIFTGR